MPRTLLYLAAAALGWTMAIALVPPPPVPQLELASWITEQEARRVLPAAPATAAPTPSSNYERFLRLADCESGEWRADGTFVEGSADWSTNTGNGYYGGLQFLASIWRAAGGTGFPHEHSRDTQIAIAESWLAKTDWSQWPACSRALGYR